MIPDTYLFVALFGEGSWANDFAFAAWHHSARSMIELQEQHGRLGMCFFVSVDRVLPSLPWMWASRRLASKPRLLLSQVVDRVGRIEAPPPFPAAFMYMYWLTAGSISGCLPKHATANPFTRASCYSWSSKEDTSTAVWQKTRTVPHFLQPPAIDKSPSQTQNVCKSKAWRDGTNLKAHIASRAFPSEIPIRGRFSNAVFNHFPLEDFLKPTRFD